MSRHRRTAKNSSPAKRLLPGLVRTIVRDFDPQKVILFGSYARGTAGADSDLDLLVVLDLNEGSKREREIEIRLALRDFAVPKDIAVTTPEQFLSRKEIPGTVERAAALEGKVLYART